MAKVSVKVIAAGLVALGVLLGAVALVAAGETSGDIEMELHAPLDAAPPGLRARQRTPGRFLTAEDSTAVAADNTW
jgi:hypothetical protein